MVVASLPVWFGAVRAVFFSLLLGCLLVGEPGEDHPVISHDLRVISP